MYWSLAGDLLCLTFLQATRIILKNNVAITVHVCAVLKGISMFEVKINNIMERKCRITFDNQTMTMVSTNK